MHGTIKTKLFAAGAMSMCATLFACNLQNRQASEIAAADLLQIKKTGELTAVTLNASTSYFIYKMEPMGYEYDLIEDFAESQGLGLNIKIAENINRLEEMLQAGEADIVAYPVQMDNTMKRKFLFCGQEQQNHLVIVQRAGKGDTIINDVTQLIGKEVHVKHNSRYHERLVSLNKELGGGIIIKDIGRDTVTTEDLIEMVSLGEIRYTVSENNLARLNKTYYRNIDIRLSISFPQRASWIVRKDSPLLAQAVNEWAANTSKSQTFRAAIKRYFERSKDESPGFAGGIQIKNKQISPFDDWFRKYAAEIGWDWQLLAAIAYQESKFHTDLESWAGAKGLMGIMPRTARALGFSPDSLKNPETSIKISAKCLANCRRTFTEIADNENLIKFTLAAYNAGNGHVSDAQRLAYKYGHSPIAWDNNVAEYIRLKSEPAYYNDTVCKHGYLRGAETFKYVNEVMARYKYYKSKVK